MMTFGETKSLFHITVFLIIIFVISIYLINIENLNISSKNYNNLQKLRLKDFDKLLSPAERKALIQQIVKESLKEMFPAGKVKLTPSFINKNLSYEKPSTFIGQNVHAFQKLFHENYKMSNNTSERNSKLKPFQVQTKIEERSMMYKLLEVFDNAMKKYNITYFMYGGTLFGSFRHHDIIPWDDDLDVIVARADHDKIKVAFKNLDPDYVFAVIGSHDKFYHKSGHDIPTYSWKWPYVDVSYYEENDTFIKDWVQTYSRWYAYPKEITFPLHNRPLLNLSLPAPKDTFAFLVWTYGFNSSCSMSGYSHMVEGSGPMGEVNCKSLVNKFPFVEHLGHKNGVREVLKYKDLEINDIVVPEPQYAVSNTFELSLKEGFQMPSHLMPPVIN